MADTKTTALTALTGANIDRASDLLMVVDVSDTTMNASGTNKKVTAAEFLTSVGAIEENVEVASVTGTKAMDLATYGRAVYTMTGNTTFSVTNPAPSGKASTAVIRIKGAFTPTLPASWDFVGGSAATYVGTGEGTTYVATTEDGGTSYQVAVLAGWA